MDICKKAKVSRRTFYRYFNNKYECIYEMGVHDLNGFEKLRLLQDQLLKTFYEDFTQSIIDELRTETPQFWEMNFNRFKEIVGMFSRVIEEGIQDGSFKKDTDPFMVIYLLCCASDTEINQRFIPYDTPPRIVIVEKTFSILCICSQIRHTGCQDLHRLQGASERRLH